MRATLEVSQKVTGSRQLVNRVQEKGSPCCPLTLSSGGTLC